MLRAYLEELKKTKLLTPEEEHVLWVKSSQGDAEAHQKLMSSYQPLVFKLAMSFQLAEQETMDLIQEGMIGLLEASESYDYTRGVAFSLFASYRIKGCMIDYLKKISSNGILYLDCENSCGTALGDILPAEQASPDELAEKKLLHERVAQALARLPEKEQCVLKSMYIEDKTAQSVADSIDVSLGYVYRLQKQGIRRVRGMLSRFMHDFNKI